MGSATWQASHLSCRQTSGDVPENKILPLFTPYWLRCYIMYPPWNQHSTWKWMLGRLVSFLEGLFSGAMLLVARVVDFQITAIKGTMWVHFGEYPRGVVLYNCYNSASGKFRLTSPPKRVLVIANMQGKLGLPVSSLMTHTHTHHCQPIGYKYATWPWTYRKCIILLGVNDVYIYIYMYTLHRVYCSFAFTYSSCYIYPFNKNTASQEHHIRLKPW